MSNVEVISPALEVKRLNKIVDDLKQELAEAQATIGKITSFGGSGGGGVRTIAGIDKDVMRYKHLFKCELIKTIEPSVAAIGKDCVISAVVLNDGSVVLMFSVRWRYALTIAQIINLIEAYVADGTNKSFMIYPDSITRSANGQSIDTRFFIDVSKNAIGFGQ